MSPQRFAETTDLVNLVAAHADFIWAAVNDVDDIKYAATRLEQAQMAADDGDALRAARWIDLVAARIFGLGSKQYADIAAFYMDDVFTPGAYF